MMTKSQDLTIERKEAVLHGILKLLDEKFYQPEKLGVRWKEAIARHRTAIIGAPTAAAFEEAVTRLLEELKTSHIGFFTDRHGGPQAGLR